MANGRANAGRELMLAHYRGGTHAEKALARDYPRLRSAFTLELDAQFRDCAWWPLDPLKDQDGWDD